MSSSVTPLKREAEEPPSVADGDAAPSHPPTEYLTLSANAEPLRLESLCTNCMENVRSAGDEGGVGHRDAVGAAAGAHGLTLARAHAQGTTTMLMTKIPFFREARSRRRARERHALLHAMSSPFVAADAPTAPSAPHVCA
jgi:hypothetical protein